MNFKKNIKKYLISLVLISISSMILAIPLYYLTSTWSNATAVDIYFTITKTLHTHSPQQLVLDVNGIPEVDYGYQNGEYVGTKRNPLTVAAWALKYYKEKQYDHFMSCVDYLVSTAEDRGAYAMWAYEFPLPSYNISGTWYSAMAQARIMTAMETAYEYSNNEKYRILSEKALNSIEVDIKDGGVLYIDPDDGGYWYAELASPEHYPPPRILNGFIFCLEDLHAYYLSTDSPKAKYLFERGEKELIQHLSEFDTGSWTYYDMEKHFAYEYHYTHIELMDNMYAYTGDEVFKYWGDQWRNYFPINPLWVRRYFAGYLVDCALIFFVILVLKLIQYHYTRNKYSKENSCGFQ